MSNELYTIVFDYRGGTYMSQVRSHSPAGAVEKWAKSIRLKREGVESPNFVKARNDFAKSMDAPGAATPIKGLQGAWCAGMLDDGLVNVVLSRKPTRPIPPEPELDEEGRKSILEMAKIIADPKSDEDERAAALITLRFIIPR